MIKNVCRYLCKVATILAQILMKIEFSPLIFEKYSNIKFYENPSSENPVVTRGRTDRHDEADNRFSQFCECA